MIDAISVLNAAQRAAKMRGAVVEIGVHHGRLFIALNLTRKSGESAVAIDLFEDQHENTDNSGRGDLQKFKANVDRWSSLDSVVLHQGDSTLLKTDELLNLSGGPVRLFASMGATLQISCSRTCSWPSEPSPPGQLSSPTMCSTSSGQA